jgi:hypothetical protein
MSGGGADDSLGSHIAAALAPLRDEALLSRDTIDAISRAPGAALPAAMTSLFGFECRLGEAEPAADFLVRTGAAPDEWPILERFVTGRGGEVWPCVADLLRQRAGPNSPLASALRNLWLEFDLVGRGDAAARPSIFFGTDRLIRGADTAWAEAMLVTLSGNAVSAAKRGCFARLTQALPASARLFQVGVMGARPDAPLRVCAIGQELAEVPSFLAAARWPGEIGRVEHCLARYAPFADHVALDFDVDDDGGLAPRIGIELYNAPDQNLAAQQRAMIERLRADDLCLPAKTNGLAAWGGITHERRHRDLWPPPLLARRAALGGNLGSTFCRWLHHVKITLEPQGPANAKAYLAIAHVFLSDATIRDAALGVTPTR